MKLKKIVSVLLCTAIALPLGIFAAAAAKKAEPVQKTVVPRDPAIPVSEVASLNEAFADGENSVILFVTGIGQSFSYLFDESYLADGAFENGTLQDYENYAPLIAEGAYSGRMLYFSTSWSEGGGEKIGAAGQNPTF